MKPDGYSDDGYPLLRILGKQRKPRTVTHHVRNASGVADLRARPMWNPGWEAQVTIEYDADIFTEQDMANLLYRAGVQNGICEGRPSSKRSVGMGWGLFEVVS